MPKETKNTGSRKRVLILGGGFGGLKAALELADNPAYQTTLISDQAEFRYYPTLYRAATGGSREASVIPLSEIFKNKTIKVVDDSVQSIDRQAKKVKTESGEYYHFDFLIVALGVITNFFGIKGLQQQAYGIKSLEEAHRLRNHLHQQLIDEGKPDVNYVIIGGGPTGVELAGALPFYIKRIMKKHGVSRRAVNVDLVEAEKHLVPRMPKAYSRAVEKRLRKLGIQLHLSQKVEAATADELMVSGKPLHTHTIVWTAGVTIHPFLATNDFALGHHGKVLVDEYLQAEPDIYVIGDNAETQYSGMAQTALYDGRFVASNLSQLAAGHPAKAYRPKKPIYVTPVGPNWAAVLWGRLQIYGWSGSLLRRAADFIGFHDLEPLLPAGRHWLAGADREESCPLCFEGKIKLQS